MFHKLEITSQEAILKFNMVEPAWAIYGCKWAEWTFVQPESCHLRFLSFWVKYVQLHNMDLS